MEETKEQIQELLTRYRRGDTDALGELVEAFRRPLYGYILRMTEGREDVDEIFQEVWLRAIKNMHKVHNHKVLSWLFRIAHNLVIDRSRRKKPDVSLQDEMDDGRTRIDRVASAGLSPDRLSGAADLGERIQALIQDLPGPQREVFLMRTEGDLSFKDIARIQKVSLNTALARMHYAVGKLREALKKDYEDFARIEA